MGRASRSSRLRRFSIGSLLVLSVVSPANSVRADDAELVAAFAYRLAMLTRWDAELDSAKKVCFAVIRDEEVAEAFSDAMRDRQLYGNDIEVRSLDSPVGAQACAVVFVGDGIVSKTLAATASSSALTVSLVKDFVEDGGMIEFIRDGGSLRFRLNRTAMLERGLTMSSKALRLAISVH